MNLFKQRQYPLYIKYFKYFLFFAFWFIAPDVFAMGVFDVVPTDKSKQYLGIIFGGNIGAISLGGGANPMLSKMFERFNFIIVTAGVIVLSYIGIVSAINTAREGEALGKKFNLWVPLRGLFGMLLMIPTPGSGYSVIQMTVIWIVLNGVGAANAIWNVVLDQMSLGIQAVGRININISNSQLEGLAKAVSSAQTCMYSLNSMDKLDLTKKNGPVKVMVNPGAVKYAPSMSDPKTLSQKAKISVGVADPNNPNLPHPKFGSICGYFSVTTSVCKADPTAMPGTNTGACSDSFNQNSITQKLNLKIAAFLAMFDAMSTSSATLATSGYDNNSPASGYYNASYEAYRSGLAALAGGVKMPVRQMTAGSSNIGFNFGRDVGSSIRGGARSEAESLRDSRSGARTAAEAAFGVAGREAGTAVESYYGPLGGRQAGTAAEAGFGAAGQVAGAAAEAGTDVAAAYTEVGGEVAGAAVEGSIDVANRAANAGASIANRAVEIWEQEPAAVAVTDSQVKDLKSVGWIHAGSYYYALTKSSAQSPLGDELTNLPKFATAPNIPQQTSIELSNPALRPTNDWTNELFEQLATPANRIKLNTALQGVFKFYERDADYSPPQSLPGLGSGQASTGNELMDTVVNKVSAVFRDPIISFFVNELSTDSSSIIRGSEDPLVTIGRFGWTIMFSSEIAIFVTIAISFTLLLGLAPMSCASSLAWGANAALMWIFGLLFGLMLLLWITGATLGIYVPLVPYLIFTTSAIGWFMAVAEALVGAPIIALALTQPGGEELGKVAQGLGIVANVFLRPTLMIFGFILAAGVLRGALTMINFGFLRAINESVLPTLFNIIPTLGLYAFLVTAVVNQAFSLIYVLPNKVLGFMGISGEGFKPDEMIQGAKGGFDKGAEVGHSGAKALHTKGAKANAYLASKLKKKGGGELPGG